MGNGLRQHARTKMAACDKGGEGNEVCCVNSTMVESHELGDQGRLPGRGDILAA